MKAYRVSEAEIWAAGDEEECRQSYRDETGEEVDDDYFAPLGDSELDAEVPELDEDDNPTGRMTTVRATLEEMRGAGPMLSLLND